MKTPRQGKGGTETTFSVNNRTGRFYWNGGDVTVLWHNFFAELPLEKERDCERIFIRRYGKILDQLFPPIPKKRTNPHHSNQ